MQSSLTVWKNVNVHQQPLLTFVGPIIFTINAPIAVYYYYLWPLTHAWCVHIIRVYQQARSGRQMTKNLTALLLSLASVQQNLGGRTDRRPFLSTMESSPTRGDTNIQIELSAVDNRPIFISNIQYISHHFDEGKVQTLAPTVTMSFTTQINAIIMCFSLSLEGEGRPTARHPRPFQLTPLTVARFQL